MCGLFDDGAEGDFTEELKLNGEDFSTRQRTALRVHCVYACVCERENSSMSCTKSRVCRKSLGKNANVNS